MSRSSSTNYSAQGECILHTTLHRAWEVLVGIQYYNEWNGFVRKVVSNHLEPVAGTQMKFTVYWETGGKATSGERVTVFSPPQHKQARWEYVFTGFLPFIGMVRATRVHELKELDDGTVYYYTIEKFRGWGKIFLPLKKVQAGFTRQTADYKKRCEQPV